MRNRALINALRDFCLDSAGLLTADLRDGAEIQFDLVDQGNSRLALYDYRPRTRDFIESRWHRLCDQTTFAPAVAALEDGADAYLNIRALTGVGPEAVIEDVLVRLYEEATEFTFPEQRFELIADEVDQAVGGVELPAAVLVRLHGIELRADVVDVERDLAIVRADALGELPPALGRARSDAVVCRLEFSQPGDAELPADEVVARLRRLMTALRLSGAAGACLAPIAWGRPSGGAWRPLPIDIGGRKRSEPTLLEPDDGADLRDLVEVLARSRYSSRVAWALNRFELGCARALATEALSDYLLALRGLLGGSDQADHRIGERLGALCAGVGDREPIAHAVRTAIAVEPQVMAGDAADVLAIVARVELCLRALLRDLVCGYLDDDLVTIADDLLVAADADLDVAAHDTRDVPAEEPLVGPSWVRERETHEMAAVELGPAGSHPIFDDEPFDPAGDDDFVAQDLSGEPDAPLADDDWGFGDIDDADLYAGPV